MKPDEVESDLYNYHLRYLVQNGLAQKVDDQYILTDLGKQFVEDISPLDPAGQSYDLFRVNILAGLVRVANGKIEILNQKRTCHPFYGDVGIIGGPVKKGERITDAAKRKFEEETGLIAEFKLLGVIRKLRYKKDGTLFSDILFHVCFSDQYSGELIEKNEFGENFWSSLNESIEFEKVASQGSRYLTALLEQLNRVPYSEIPLFYHEEVNILEGF